MQTLSIVMRQQSDLGNVHHGPATLGLLDAGTSNGVELDSLPVGAVLEVDTSHTRYLLENRGEGNVVLSGHPEFCPEPVLVKFHGSVGGPALIKTGRIEPGLKMAFQHPKFGTLRTSRVVKVRQTRPAREQ